MIFKNKYDWCLINLTTGKLYSKFDEVLYRDNASEESPKTKDQKGSKEK